MKLLFVSDSFKGSITNQQSISLLTKAANEVFNNCECIGLPIADGGEGTTDAVIESVGGKLIHLNVHGPLMENTNAYYGALDNKRAVLEMAQASGLPLVPIDKRNPLNTTSFGTGEMICDALDRGFTDISVAIGGSATNDCGMGCMRALGIKFYAEDHTELMGFGRDLGKVRHIDISGLHPKAADAKFTIMCDVDNPLCGSDGATYTFGPQKGGTPQILEKLETDMQSFRDIIVQDLGTDPSEIPGAGAAGGLGAAFLVFLSAQLKSGIETVLELINFDSYLPKTDLVVTGEGRVDWQSCHGKVIYGIGMHCKTYGVPVAALVGSMGKGAEEIFQYGITSIMTTVNAPMDIDDAVRHAEELYYNAAIRMFRFINLSR